jgi:hypothetical protein
MIFPTDLVATDLIYRDRIGETYDVKYNPAHQWFCVSGMRPNEVVLFKGYDSSSTMSPGSCRIPRLRIPVRRPIG